MIGSRSGRKVKIIIPIPVSQRSSSFLRFPFQGRSLRLFSNPSGWSSHRLTWLSMWLQRTDTAISRALAVCFSIALNPDCCWRYFSVMMPLSRSTWAGTRSNATVFSLNHTLSLGSPFASNHAIDSTMHLHIRSFTAFESRHSMSCPRFLSFNSPCQPIPCVFAVPSLHIPRPSVPG